jgi:methylthioribose-1-phosphate isomerase
MLHSARWSIYVKETYVRTIDWIDGQIQIIDQTRLPTEEFVLSLNTAEDLAEAISQAASLPASTRPATVNLKWPIDRVEKVYDPTQPRMVSELIEQARAMVAEDEKVNRIIGEVGADLLALAAQANGVPFIVAAPSSTIDLDALNGDAM